MKTTALLVLYPLIVPIWQNGPLINDSKLATPRSPVYVVSDKLDFQQKSFLSIKDPRLKSRIVSDLSRTNNPYAVKILTSLLLKLQAEDNSALKKDSLKALYNMRDIALPSQDSLNAFAKFAISKDSVIRGYAYALLLEMGADPDKTVLTGLKNEKSLFVINLVTPILQKKADQCNIKKLEELLNAGSPAVSAAAARILASRKENPDSIGALYSVISKKQPIQVRVALAEVLALRKSCGIELLKKLSSDESPAVRALVASAFPSIAMLPVYKKLVKDNNWDVRRAAADTLGGYTPDKVAATLLPLLKDPVSELRTAAAGALIKISPSENIIQEIGGAYLPDKRSRPESIAILGALHAVKFAPDIERYLNTSDDDNIVLRSIRALDSLNYRQAEPAVRGKAFHKNPEIRIAVAHALGKFADKKSYDTLINLSIMPDSKDVNAAKFAKVAPVAIESMGRIADPFFIKRLYDVIHDVKTSTSTMRAAACWSIARIGKITPQALKQFKTLALKKSIPSEGGKEYDSDLVRISICLALIDLGQKEPAMRKKAESIIKKFFNPDAGSLPFAGSDVSLTLREYARQAYLYMKGQSDITPSKVPPREIGFTVTKYK